MDLEKVMVCGRIVLPCGTNQTVKEYKYGTDKSDIFVNEKWFIE